MNNRYHKELSSTTIKYGIRPRFLVEVLSVVLDLIAGQSIFPNHVLLSCNGQSFTMGNLLHVYLDIPSITHKPNSAIIVSLWGLKVIGQRSIFTSDGFLFSFFLGGVYSSRNKKIISRSRY